MDWTRFGYAQATQLLRPGRGGAKEELEGTGSPTLRYDSAVSSDGLAGTTEERRGERQRKRARSRATGERAISCLSEP